MLPRLFNEEFFATLDGTSHLFPGKSVCKKNLPELVTNCVDSLYSIMHFLNHNKSKLLYDDE